MPLILPAHNHLIRTNYRRAMVNAEAPEGRGRWPQKNRQLGISHADSLGPADPSSSTNSKLCIPDQGFLYGWDIPVSDDCPACLAEQRTLVQAIPARRASLWARAGCRSGKKYGISDQVKRSWEGKKAMKSPSLRLVETCPSRTHSYRQSPATRKRDSLAA